MCGCIEHVALSMLVECLKPLSIDTATPEQIEAGIVRVASDYCRLDARIAIDAIAKHRPDLRPLNPTLPAPAAITLDPSPF